MIVGTGIDLVSISRFGEALARTPSLSARLFVPAEAALPLESLAARFAAKEAVVKVLRRPAGLSWHDVVVRRTENGAPELTVSGYEQLRWHVSLTHEADLAMAFVLAESESEGDDEPESEPAEP